MNALSGLVCQNVRRVCPKDGAGRKIRTNDIAHSVIKIMTCITISYYSTVYRTRIRIVRRASHRSPRRSADRARPRGRKKGKCIRPAVRGTTPTTGGEARRARLFRLAQHLVAEAVRRGFARA